MKCRIHVCKKPVDNTEVFDPKTMEEPDPTKEDICINQDGFHRGRTWFKFVPSRVSNSRFKNRIE